MNEKQVIAQFRDKHGGVWWGPVEMVDSAPPKHAKLEQHAGTFIYDHDDHGPIYQEAR